MPSFSLSQARGGMFELFRKYRTPLLACALVLAALLFYSAQLRKREQTTLFEKTIIELASPIQRVIDAVGDQIVYVWTHYFWLVQTAAENDRLLTENREYLAALNRMEEIRLANERLRQLLAFRDTVELPMLPAQVIAEDVSSWFRTIIIDKGTEQGVGEGMPVVVAEGVVGRIIKATPYHSRVLLITDASSAVASLVQRNRTRGVVRGRGDTLTFDFALRQKDVELGDKVITSGTGGVFPRGLVLGEVSRISREEYGLFQSLDVTPAVDFSRLEEVLVLIKPKEIDQEEQVPEPDKDKAKPTPKAKDKEKE